MLDAHTSFASNAWRGRFRGNFIKIILEDAGVEYTTASAADTVGLKSKAPAEQPTPMLAPPMVSVGDFYVNQMPAASQYLARK